MEPITFAEAVQAMSAGATATTEAPFTGICTDTRHGALGALFFALPGENADGHEYVARAFEAGALAAVVNYALPEVTGPQLVVADTLIALGDLARHYRRRFTLPVIGVTGSVGKTSTKEMISSALRGRFNTLANEKNFNNEIGVPLTLFALDSSHRAAVVEMGMRGRGEIARLAEIAEPTFGVITNIGLSHIERLGSRDEIALAKRELFEALPAGGTAVFCADDDYAAFLDDYARENAQAVTFGLQAEADFRAANVTFAPDGGSRFTVNGQPFVLHAPGVHHIANAACACAVAASLGIPLEEVAAQLETFRSPAMRMEAVELSNGVLLLNDAYNAAPDSMHAALQTLTLLAGGRRTVAILGDMKELGDYSSEAHQFVGDLAAQQDVDLLVTVGEAAQEIADTALSTLGEERIFNFPDTDTAAQKVGMLLQLHDVVLVKGSRAMEMERIVRALQAL